MGGECSDYQTAIPVGNFSIDVELKETASGGP